MLNYPIQVNECIHQTDLLMLELDLHKILLSTFNLYTWTGVVQKCYEDGYEI